jgi:hypothetical protein
MTYKTFLDEIANEFLYRIQDAYRCTEIPTEDFGWSNYRYESELFRLAHVERYSDEKIEVLHVTTFPNSTDPSPIFGFDVIATEKKVLGCYFDLSPVSQTQYFLSNTVEFNEHFPKRKELPAWADGIFSKDVCFIEPDNDLHFSFFCMQSLKAYSEYLEISVGWSSPLEQKTIISGQNRYCEVQSKNPRTFSVLKQKLGEERAKYFMEEILFPKIK